MTRPDPHQAATDTTVVAFVERGGWVVFTCTGCGIVTHSFAPPDRRPLCLTCRFIAAHPDLPEAARRLLRGEPS